jgi:protein-S-isoprenylcysteine O-methyltransferase Ste14
VHVGGHSIRIVVWLLAIYKVILTWWLIYRTGEEDRLLKREFGAQWDKWAENTRYRVIPFVL